MGCKLLKRLRKIDLRYVKCLSVDVFTDISKLDSLLELNLQGTNTGDEGMHQLSNDLENLKSLNLYMCYNITDKGVSYLKKLLFLEQLDVGGCARITDVSASYISKLTSLKKLNMSHTYITDDSIMSLHPLSNLRELEIFACTLLTDTAMSHIAKLQSLEYLDITYNNITDVGLQDLRSVTSLKELRCSHTSITDAAIRPFDDRMEVEWQ